MIQDHKPYKILVIEDNFGDYIIVEELLKEKIAYPEISHAPDFRTASAMLAGADLHFDVILLDISLPDKIGKELIDLMLEIGSSFPIIILTGFGDMDFSKRSISSGIADYLIKDDLNPETLYKSIIYAIERKKIVFDLKESEKRFSDLFQLSPQPKWIYDCNTLKIVQVNAAACRHYGYSTDEFLQMTISDLEPEAVECEQYPTYNTGKKHRKKSGEIIYVELFRTEINVRGNKFTSVIAIDITEKNNFEIRLSEAIIKAQEEERYDIGSELHDNVCQILATSNIRLGMLREKLPSDVAPMLKQCSDSITMASREIRRLSHKLAPAFYDFRTLHEEFSTLLNSFHDLHNYAISLCFDSHFNRLGIEKEIKLNLYRILQEQLVNIAKYANGTLVEVCVAIQGSRIIMTITDDGIGMHTECKPAGIGFANMKRRAAVFGGRFALESQPGKGCKVVIEIPFATREE